MTQNMEHELSNNQLEILRRIREKGSVTLKRDVDKSSASHLINLGIISLKAGCKATYVMNEDAKKSSCSKANGASTIEADVIVQKLDASLRKQFDELKLYIDKRLDEYRDTIEMIISETRRMDESKFLEATRMEYIKLSQSSPIAPYVLVSQLRDFVCSKLHIDRGTFDTMLLSVANRDPHTVQLSTGGGESGTGIFYGRGECHAAIIK
ncbi:MAG: hypothetical protein SVY53_12650 [Chloroflexota bacterium]|nr:hypothetical protein [Chloroflexota bacterium]